MSKFQKPVPRTQSELIADLYNIGEKLETAITEMAKDMSEMKQGFRAFQNGEATEMRRRIRELETYKLKEETKKEFSASKITEIGKIVGVIGGIGSAIAWIIKLLT